MSDWKNCNCWILLLITFLASPTVGQEDDTSAQDEPHQDLAVVKSIGLSGEGVSYLTSFKLRDEAGLEYDVMSLLADPGASNQIGLSQEQSEQLRALRNERAGELAQAFDRSLLQEEKLLQIKDRFNEVESEMYSLLTDDQLSKLTAIRIQAGIKKFGEDYLLNEGVQDRLGIQSKQAEKIKENISTAKSDLEDWRKKQIEKANRTLIGKLNEEHQELLRESLGDDGSMDEFLATPLFISKSIPRKLSALKEVNFLRILKLRSIRQELELTSVQEEELGLRGSSDADDSKEMDIQKILSSEQWQKLNHLVIRRCFTKKGTVKSLCSGPWAKQWDLDEEFRQTLFEQGKKLHHAIIEGLAVRKAELFESLISVSKN